MMIDMLLCADGEWAAQMEIGRAKPVEQLGDHWRGS